MKRQKGQKPKVEDIKRQKSVTENSKIPNEHFQQGNQVVNDKPIYDSQLKSDNLQPDSQLTCDNGLDSQQTCAKQENSQLASEKQRQNNQNTTDNLQNNSQLASEKQYNLNTIDNLQNNRQLASDEFQQDSTFANVNLQKVGQENKKTVTHRVNDKYLTISEDENPLKTTVGEDVNASKYVSRVSHSFKSICNESKMKLKYGFGFTENTFQFRTTENCKQPTSSSRDKNRGQCCGKYRSKSKRKTSVDGSINGSYSSLSTEGPKSENSISAHIQVVLPGGMKSDEVIDESRREHELQFMQSDRIFKTQQLSACDFEMDVIYTKDLQQERLDQAPEQVPADYVDMSPQRLPTQQRVTCFQMIRSGKQKPDQVSIIVISHKNSDKPEGDKFGAKLCTFTEKRKDGSVYHRHFLVGVDDAGPAGQLGLENNDELVLVKDVLVPLLTHTDVLNLFHGVPVDGRTRFTLVVRRLESKSKWEWIETSAILTANKTSDEGPFIEYPEYRTLRGRVFEEVKSRHLYKVPGTEKYLDISDRGICIETINHDPTEKTKIIWKRTKYWQADSEGHLDFAYALCDVTMKRYIAVEKRNNTVILKDSPDWFKMITVGSIVRFQFNDKYIGYDTESGYIKMQTGNCVFEELPASVLGSVDTHTASLSTVPVPVCSEDVSDNASSNIFKRGSSSSNDYHLESDADALSGNILDDTSAASNKADLETVSETSYSKILETGSHTNDNTEISEIPSYLSRIDSFNSSQASNTSQKSAADLSDSHYFGADSSGYGSGSLTPPESLDVGTSVDRDFFGNGNLYGTICHPKTPTTPMGVLSLSEKDTFNI